MLKKVVVTGASGFVGQPLCALLSQKGYEVRKLSRSDRYDSVLDGAEVVVHLAARVHVMRDQAKDPLAAFRAANVQGTKQLAEQCVRAGVKRFVFVSSLHVNGTISHDQPFTEADVPHPASPYAISKWEAEQVLHKIASDSGLEVVIVRPPLVYGPQVKANFLSLLKIVYRHIPLPFKSIQNKRSLISLKNLVDFLACCVEHPQAANQTFLISDGEDLSIADLISRLSRGFGKKARLFSVPSKMLYWTGKLFGKADFIDRLCGSLQADISKARQILGWVPVQTVDEGLQETAEWYEQVGG